MVRTLRINIRGYYWEIGTEGMGLKYNSPFAQCEVGSALTYLYNYDLTERDLAMVRVIGGVFFEKCFFVFIPSHDEKKVLNTQIEQSFEGTFVDAFVFIQQVFEKKIKEGCLF
jgi:hypothetical protein